MNHRQLTYPRAQSMFLWGQTLALRAARAGTIGLAGAKHAVGCFIKPLNSPTRYPEYALFLDLLRDEKERAGNDGLWALDVGSPKLFSLLAADHLGINITSIDIWERAILEAQALVGGLDPATREKLRLGVADVRKPLPPALLPPGGAFDVCYAMSVIEHVEPNPGGDAIALRRLASHTKTCGAVVVSVPVDRELRDEHTPKAHYGASSVDEERGDYFFQRVYDTDRLKDLVSFVASDLVLEEVISIAWPRQNAFQAFWRIKSTKIKGLLGPAFPFFASGFSVRAHGAEIPSIDFAGDIILKFRKRAHP